MVLLTNARQLISSLANPYGLRSTLVGGNEVHAGNEEIAEKRGDRRFHPVTRDHRLSMPR
jgi:hypothetical protein